MSAPSQECGILVIGAGLLGSSVAMQLARLGADDVRVVDFDLEGAFSSSELNAGGVRATWIEPINIQTSKLSIEYFAQHAADVGYRDCGYLWLHRPDRWKPALQARERQVAMGWPVEVWDVPTLRRKVPFIDKTEDLAGAVFAPRDGLVNPNLLKMHYRKKAAAAGVSFTDRIWIRGAEKTSGQIRLKGFQFDSPPGPEEKKRVFSGKADSVLHSEVEIRASIVINCAGPWAPVVARALGYECPSRPVRRQICIFDCRDVDLTPYGMIVDASSLYFHPEAANGLAGFANTDEPDGVNFEYDGEKFFMDRIWPVLYERSSAFERLKHLTGWAGLYETSPDDSAIVGEAPGGGGKIFEAHSFSGHGAMHSYAAGLAIAERVVRGRYETLDLTPLSADRFAKNQLIRESLII